MAHPSRSSGIHFRKCSTQASSELFGQDFDMGLLKHSQVITGNYPDIEPSGSQLSPALLGIVRGEERLHARSKEGDTTRIDSRPIVPQRLGLCPSDLTVLLREVKEVSHFIYELC